MMAALVVCASATAVAIGSGASGASAARLPKRTTTTVKPSTASTTSTTVASTTTSTSSPTSTTVPTGSLFSDGFSHADGLITNEYAYWNPGASNAVRSTNWELTSGSLFERNGSGWTGAPDTVDPNATSSNGTDSAVFRLTTQRADFGDVAVSFSLVNNALTTTASTPAVAWDGLHIFLRYQSEYNLYYASVNRRDGTVVIKKKCVGGPDNGGTYYELSNYVSGHAIPFGAVQNVQASVQNNADGSVTIQAYREGQLVAQGTDSGIGCAVIRAPGKVGIRGDNDDFTFDNFTVTGL